MNTNKASSREAILNAVEAVIAEIGAARMSLDAVARKAGVSKGGLMYHFPTKQALVKALVDRHITEFHAIIKESMKKTEDISRFPEIFLDCVMRNDQYRKRIGKAIFTACLNDPELLKPFDRIRQEVMREMKNAGLGAERVTVLLYAVDGIVLRELLQTSLLTVKEKETIKKELLIFIHAKK